MGLSATSCKTGMFSEVCFSRATTVPALAYGVTQGNQKTETYNIIRHLMIKIILQWSLSCAKYLPFTTRQREWGKAVRTKDAATGRESVQNVLLSDIIVPGPRFIIVDAACSFTYITLRTSIKLSMVNSQSSKICVDRRPFCWFIESNHVTPQSWCCSPIPIHANINVLHNPHQGHSLSTCRQNKLLLSRIEERTSSTDQPTGTSTFRSSVTPRKHPKPQAVANVPVPHPPSKS